MTTKPEAARLRTAYGLQRLESNVTTSAMEFTDPITVFMATYPGGFDNVADAVRSLLQQSLAINKLVLHVNGTRRPPRLPKIPDWSFDSQKPIMQTMENLSICVGQRGTSSPRMMTSTTLMITSSVWCTRSRPTKEQLWLVYTERLAIWPTIHTLEPIRQHASITRLRARAWRTNPRGRHWNRHHGLPQQNWDT